MVRPARKNLKSGPTAAEDSSSASCRRQRNWDFLHAGHEVPTTVPRYTCEPLFWNVALALERYLASF